jgi:hypothetical protein
MPRPSIPPAEFKAAQAALLRAGKPEDACGRCGCPRAERSLDGRSWAGGHLPKPTFSHAKSGSSSGRSKELPVLAPTSCDCSCCICFCTGWIEPFAGQPFLRCTYTRDGARAPAEPAEPEVMEEIEGL